MCLEACKRGSTLCVINVVVGHVVVIIAIILALVTRYAIYPDQLYMDMPTDMRVLHRQSNSILCDHHEIEVIRETDQPFTNTIAQFDIWKLSSRPNASSLVPRPSQDMLISVAALEKTEYKRYVFHLLPGEEVVMNACAEMEAYSPGLPLYIYVIQGESALSDLLKQLDKSILAECPQCLTQKPIELQGSIDCTAGKISEVTFTLDQSVTQDEDDYAFVFFYPKNESKSVAAQEFVSAEKSEKFRVQYLLSRKQYSETVEQSPNAKNVNLMKVDPDEYPVLEFNSYRQNKENELYNLVVTFRCVPHTTYYMLFFGAIPMVILIILLVITMAKQNSSQSGYDRIN